jgi:hypothetical protein
MGFPAFFSARQCNERKTSQKVPDFSQFQLTEESQIESQNNYLFGLFQSLPTIGSHSCSMSFHQNLPSRLSFRVPSLFNLSQQGWLPSVVSQVNAMLKTERTVNQREVQNMTQIPCGPCFIVGEAFGSTKKSVDFLDFGIEPCMDILPT